MPPLTREERVSKARVEISSQFNSNQQAFLEFVLSHFVNVGVQELDQDKLTSLLRLKCHDSLPDAVADLGAPKQIQEVFIGFHTPSTPSRSYAWNLRITKRRLLRLAKHSASGKSGSRGNPCRAPIHPVLSTTFRLSAHG